MQLCLFCVDTGPEGFQEAEGAGRKATEGDRTDGTPQSRTRNS